MGDTQNNTLGQLNIELFSQQTTVPRMLEG